MKPTKENWEKELDNFFQNVDVVSAYCSDEDCQAMLLFGKPNIIGERKEGVSGLREYIKQFIGDLLERERQEYEQLVNKILEEKRRALAEEMTKRLRERKEVSEKIEGNLEKIILKHFGFRCRGTKGEKIGARYVLDEIKKLIKGV